MVHLHYSYSLSFTTVYTVVMCMCIKSREFKNHKSYCRSDSRERWEPWGGVRCLCACACVFVWLIAAVCGVHSVHGLLYLHPYLSSLSITPAFFSTLKHTHRMSIILLSALPGVWTASVGVGWGERHWDRVKEIDSVCLVLCCSRLWHVNSNFTFFESEIWQCSSYPFIVIYFLHSSHFVMFPSSIHSECPQFVCEAFQTGFTKFRRTKPGWQTKTLTSAH